MLFNRAVPVNRLVNAIADSALYHFQLTDFITCDGFFFFFFFFFNLEAQVNTQEYGRRPYGVGFLVIGFDESGPHLFEFSPSGNSYEYYAISIGARSQSAKTYLEKHYEEFADGECLSYVYWGIRSIDFIRFSIARRSGAPWTPCPSRDVTAG